MGYVILIAIVSVIMGFVGGRLFGASLPYLQESMFLFLICVGGSLVLFAPSIIFLLYWKFAEDFDDWARMLMASTVFNLTGGILSFFFDMQDLWSVLWSVVCGLWFVVCNIALGFWNTLWLLVSGLWSLLFA
jgi:hypothetical protein